MSVLGFALPLPRAETRRYPAAMSDTPWRERAQTLQFPTQAFVDGRFVPAASGRTFEARSAADGRLLAELPECDRADVDRAVAAARTAFEDGRWSRMHPRARGKVLRRLADLVERHREELALLETLDAGKPIRHSLRVDLHHALQGLQFYGEAADKVFGEVAPSGTDGLGLVTREPIGVVGAVIPWNFPLMMAVWKIAPALVAGNSVVLKPAEQSSLSALRLAELAAEAGLPEGVLNVLPGFGPTAGAAIGLHPDIDAVAFTGSTEVGKLFLRYSGDSNMKRVHLETGGKSPNIIFADAPDIDFAAGQAAIGVFFNAGQMCTAGSRVLVQASIVDRVLEGIAKVGAKLQPGDPLDPGTKQGALIDRAQFERVMSYIELGKQEATLHAGGAQARADSGGFYVEPTIFSGVDNQMTIAREEIFGPVLGVIPFDTPEDAIAIANDTDYGLAAAVWTSDRARAHTMARRLRAGTVWVNNFDGSEITTPFGGFKQSGFGGRDKSLHAIEHYTELKTTWIRLEGRGATPAG